MRARSGCARARPGESRGACRCSARRSTPRRLGAIDPAHREARPPPRAPKAVARRDRPGRRREGQIAGLLPARDRGRARSRVAPGCVRSIAPTTAVDVTVTARTPDGTGSGWARRESPTRPATSTPPRSPRSPSTRRCARRSRGASSPAVHRRPRAGRGRRACSTFLTGALDARRADEGRSFFARPGGGTRLGEKLFARRDHAALRSDRRAPRPAPFDGEGLPLAPDAWIDKGVVAAPRLLALLGDSSRARPRPAPGCAGSSTAARRPTRRADQGRQARRADHAVLVHCAGSIPQTLLVTGLTRDGTFLIENGEITAPGEQLPVQRVAGADARARGRDDAIDDRRGHAGPCPADPRLQPRVDLGGRVMASVVVTADRALTDDGARGATAVLAVDGAIVAVGDPAAIARRSARRRRAPDRLGAPRDGARHRQHPQPQLPVAAARHRRRPAVPRVARPGALPLLAAARRRGHGAPPRCSRSARCCSTASRPSATSTTSTRRATSTRPRRSRPRAGSGSGSCSRAASTTGTARPRRIARPIPQAIANFEALHAPLPGSASGTSSRSSPRRTASTARRPAMIEAGAGCARDAGVPWHIHLAEEQYQVDAVARAVRQAPAARGRRPRTSTCPQMIAVHGCWFDAGERALLAERGGVPRLLPGLEHVPRRRRDRPRRPRRARRARSASAPTAAARTTGSACSTRCAPPRCSRRSTASTARRSTPRPASRSARAPPARSCGCRSGGSPPGYRCDLVGARSRRSVAVAGAGPRKERGLRAVVSRDHRRRGRWTRKSSPTRRLCHVPLDEIQARVAELTRDWRRD